MAARKSSEVLANSCASMVETAASWISSVTGSLEGANPSLDSKSNVELVTFEGAGPILLE